ncbi:MAG: class I SAM-dependent methyltransferase [Nitrososphaerales archaeon]|nr:class I SAM-dependent methyltransferase [Nitrososphaerales archaeon]
MLEQLGCYMNSSKMAWVADFGAGDNPDPRANVTVDIRPLKHKRKEHVMADLRHPPFRPGSLDMLVSFHTLEHFSHREVEEIFSRWVGTVKPGGFVEVEVPNLTFSATIILIATFLGKAVDIHYVYGEQDNELNLHRAGFTSVSLKRLAEGLGLIFVRKLPPRLGASYAGLNVGRIISVIMKTALRYLWVKPNSKE